VISSHSFPSLKTAQGVAVFMHTEEHPYRSPAAIVSLRPVTLRPYLSISLPSDFTLLCLIRWGQFLQDGWIDFRIIGKPSPTYGRFFKMGGNSWFGFSANLDGTFGFFETSV